MYVVYKHENKINHKVYIGQTNDISRRWSYNGIMYKTCPRFYSAIQHYGWDSFDHVILYNNLSQQEANYYEQLMIKEYDSVDPDKGYNILSGGQGLSDYWTREENRKRQSDNKKRYYEEHPEKKNFFVEWDLNHPEQKEKHKILMKEKYGKGINPLCKINEARKTAIKCVETEKIFESLMAASRYYNLPPGNISKCLHGQRKTCGGYHWEFV